MTITIIVSTRITDATMIEQCLLELAYTTDAKITASALAYFAPCSIENASRVLDELTARERLTLEIQDDGGVYYELPGRQQIKSHAAPGLSPIRREALVPVPRQREASPALAAVLSFFMPGAGHAYTGRIVSAILWFMAVGLGCTLIIPGLVLHLFAIASAAASARRLNSEASRPLLLRGARTSL